MAAMWNRLAPSAVVLLAGVACSKPAPSDRKHEAAPEGEANSDPARPPRIEAPASIVTDVATSEDAADAVAKQVGGHLCEALMRENTQTAKQLLTEDFGAVLGGDTLDADGFVGALFRLRAELSVAERCKLKPVAFALATDETWARVDFWFVLAGRDAEQRARLDRGHLIARVEHDPSGAWALARAEAEPFETRVSSTEGFVDVTALVGAKIERSEQIEAIRRLQIDGRAILSFGGLAVGDFDRDGFSDLLVSIAGEGAWMLHNDGQGAFERSASLLAPEEVGVFTMLVDLDGDRVDELISTAVVACEQGQAELGLWVKRGERWAPSAEPLRFAAPCRAYQQIRFEHIAADDLDGDGQIDLVVSGYSNSESKGSRFNSYDARDGQRNLLFFGRGDLAFEELGEARGLSERRFTFATAIHDFDDDGDRDLYSVNDYGSNTWLDNDGAGSFAPVESGGPLAESGNSMGVSVVDLDGDLDLDVYVSNMYSSAGNRLIPLVAGEVSPTTHETLLAMAAGNSLYAREGEGWREIASELGVRKAGWAWGHTVCDLDNDGDREIYVANGLTSHSDAKAPDF